MFGLVVAVLQPSIFVAAVSIDSSHCHFQVTESIRLQQEAQVSHQMAMEAHKTLKHCSNLILI